MAGAVVEARVGLALPDTPRMHAVQTTLSPPPQVLELPVEDESSDAPHVAIPVVHGGSCWMMGWCGLRECGRGEGLMVRGVKKG